MDSLMQNTLLLVVVGIGLAIFVVALVGIATAIIAKCMPAPVQPRVEPAPAKETVVPQAAPAPVAAAPAPAKPVEAPAPAPVAAPGPAKPVEEPKEVDKHTLAVISAAIAAVFGPGFHIRTIRQLPEFEGASWARAGRLSLQESHNIATRSTR